MLAAAFLDPRAASSPRGAHAARSRPPPRVQLAIANGLRPGLGNAGYASARWSAGGCREPVGRGRVRARARGVAAALVALARLEPDPRPPTAGARPARSVTAELLLGLREVHGATTELREVRRAARRDRTRHGVLDVLMVVVAVQLVGLGTGGVGI